MLNEKASYTFYVINVDLNTSSLVGSFEIQSLKVDFITNTNDHNVTFDLIFMHSTAIYKL